MSEFKAPVPFQEAVGLIRSILPASPPWVFYNLNVDVTLMDDEPVVTWSAAWQRVDIGASGDVTSDTVEGLMEMIAQTVREVDSHKTVTEP